jgi:hypothetical protein
VGEGTSRAVREIEEARQRLEGSLEELAGRLPRLQQAGAEAGRKVVIPAVGAAAGGLAVWLVDRRLKKRRAVREAAAQALPEEWVDAFRDGGWKGPAVIAAGVWGIVKLAELGSMRRLRKVLARSGGLAPVAGPTSVAAPFGSAPHP